MCRNKFEIQAKKTKNRKDDSNEEDEKISSPIYVHYYDDGAGHKRKRG